MPPFIRCACLLLTLLSAALQLEAGPLPGNRVILTNSVVALPAKVTLGNRPLSPAELVSPLEFEITLNMRNFPRLLERVGRSAKVLNAEMERNHSPRSADYDALVHWLITEGFAVTSISDNRLSVFAIGTVEMIQKSFQVTFGPVTVEGANYVSALGAPSLPDFLAQSVLGINGLQPYLKMHKGSARAGVAIPSAATSTNAPPYLVSDILGAYNARNLGVTGSGQKIAILIDTVPRDSDVSTFWNDNGIAQSLGNLEKINVNGVVLKTPTGEETLDVEWSSGIAPGAKVRIYAAGSLQFTDLDKALQRIISDLPTQPQLHQLSISLGLGETYLASSSQMQTDAQYFATLANSGVSIFVSSGDGGSNPTNTGGAGGPLQVEYYSSDPSVTGVGGSSLTLNTTTGAVSSETGWAGSGGGISQTFSRPSWQSGPGVPAGSMRLVPDVCGVANPNTGAYVILSGSMYQYGGTSWSAPVWAGYSALINEARAKAGLPPEGLFNPDLYRLIGTNNFRDITAGNNGSYSAGTGFDMVTGVGVPNVSALMLTLTGQGSGPPTISGFTPTSGLPASEVVISGLNLVGASSVAVNGVNLSFAVNSGLQITATAPSYPISGPITVSTPQGTGTSSELFSVVLSTGTLTTFSTGFETAEGYPLATGSVPSTSSVSLSGTQSWTRSGSGGQGLLSQAGSGQQAFIGFSAPSDVNDTLLWKPVPFTPVSGDLLHFAVQMAIIDSTNKHHDQFSWNAYNASGHRFFSVFFDNHTNAIGYLTESGSAVNATPLLVNGHAYTLEVSMNFGQNTWGATLDGTEIIANQPITTTGAPLNFGYMAVAWHLLGRNASSWGNNYMVFDHYSIGRSNPSQPLYTVATAALIIGTVTGGGSFFSGDSATLSAAAGVGAAFVNWTENAVAVSGSSDYTFPVTANRSLFANFQPILFSAWKALHFTEAEQGDPSISGVSADPDRDGLVNLMEYACDLDPKRASPAGQPIQTTIQNGVLSLTYARNKNATDLGFLVEVSPDLLHWNSGPAYTSTPAILSDDGLEQTVKVNDLTPVSSTNRRFIRLRVTGQ